MSTGTQTATPLPRNAEEIVARIKEAQPRDWLGFEYLEYFAGLTFEQARPLLKPGASPDNWHDEPTTVEALSARARDYVAFWLEKIERERGISVCRATSHFVAWKWMLGHPDADTFPGAPNGLDGGWYQRDAYDYIRAQMDTGEWDRLTAEATHA